MAVLPATQREVRLLAKPTGLPRPEHFGVVETPVVPPGEGEVLVRNLFFHVFATLRILIAGATQDTPFPVLTAGDTLVGAAIGEVVEAPADSGFGPGDLVSHWLGWREYALVPVAECTLLDRTVLPDPVAHLQQGWTAYAALTRGVELRSGDTVFVSAGGSGIGSMAGLIARQLGAERVIASTGSREKAERLRTELGYDDVVVRGEGPLAEQLTKAAPDGIDVYFDNVGGEQLRAAVDAARPGARFVLIGALSGQLAPDGTGTTAPVELDSLPLIHKRIEMRGFSSDDYDDRDEWTERFGAWLRAGEITFPHVRVRGIENAPRTLLEVIEGRHIGAVVVEL
ncbi:MDR family NADP-dependent oxidoreductase [Streptomyces lomondensis]|uniref:NADP-dependent oxidoreductase n=1 Tax=Streptomyces lomondensis TaxID=68229 RepID=A0ABQ2X3G0_9ACTN|nr:NADP-dependent oxidoreductase [Streptomyces lomondensis]MCF0079950.1 NADP-dependent oxidoreductase [Streptomyces lomondensis]GGW97220.1 NADP-dependent oxidoreductase [Streptomyces lomondensis]